MGSQHLYSLSWGELGTSLTSTVQILRGHNEMVDVTLTAGGKIFTAHKLVLSAASPLLMELLKSTHCQHPVLMLAGVTAHDLEALLQFVYQGEVSVDPSQLPSLLQAAHCLDIQALSPQTLTTDKTMAQIPVPVVMNEPMREVVMNEPMREVVMNEPMREVVMNEQMREVVMNESMREGVINEPMRDVVMNEPMREVVMNEQMREVVMNDPMRDMNHMTTMNTGPMSVMNSRDLSEHSALLPVRKRKRKHRSDSDSEGIAVKWTVTEEVDGVGVSVGVNVVETREMDSISDLQSGNNSMKDDMLDEQNCNCEPSGSKILVSNLPVECTICGVTLRQSRNLRRHMELIHLKGDNMKRKLIIGQEDTTKADEGSVGSVQCVQTLTEVGDQLEGGGPGPSRLLELPPPPSHLHTLTSPPLIYHTSSHSQVDPYLHTYTQAHSQTHVQTLSQTHTMQFTHDSVFRQELLRGAGLYADTREHCATE